MKKTNLHGSYCNWIISAFRLVVILIQIGRKYLASSVHQVIFLKFTFKFHAFAHKMLLLCHTKMIWREFEYTINVASKLVAKCNSGIDDYHNPIPKQSS